MATNAVGESWLTFAFQDPGARANGKPLRVAIAAGVAKLVAVATVPAFQASYNFWAQFLNEVHVSASITPGASVNPGNDGRKNDEEGRDGMDGKKIVDVGMTMLGKDGMKIDEPELPTVVTGVSPGVAGATVVPDGASEPAGAAVSPGIEAAGTDSAMADTSELVVSPLESSPPRVLYTIKPTPTRRTMTEIGVSAFFHMSADNSTVRKGV